MAHKVGGGQSGDYMEAKESMGVSGKGQGVVLYPHSLQNTDSFTKQYVLNFL